MIPASIMLKLGKYKIEVNGAEIKVTVVHHSSVVDTYISQFRSLVQRDVVGFDIKSKTDYGPCGTAFLLVLCVGTRCLIFQLRRLGPNIPESLKEFLYDERICFVRKRTSFKSSRSCFFSTILIPGIEIGELAARVLKRAELEKLGLRDLASAVGVTIDQPGGESSVPGVPDWNSIVFSTEACTCFAIGNKLISNLN